jgi:hypothetical protein
MTETQAKYYKKGGHPKWDLQTKRYNVLTVVLLSPLPLRSRSSMLVRDMLMSPSVALFAVKQGEPSAIALVVTDLAAKCIPQYVLSVVKNVKCPLSLERAGQYIVVSATARLN